MALGMTQEEFWKGPPRLVEAYRKLSELKAQEKNQEAWWQGLYFYKALDTLAFNLTKHKGVATARYPEEPFRITPYTEEEKAERAERERLKALEFFKRQAEAWSKQHGR